MRKHSPQKTMIIACIVMALGIWYISHIKGCDCITAEQIVPILATGIAIGSFIFSFKEWREKRKEKNDL